MKVNDFLMTSLRSIAAVHPVGSAIVNGWNEVRSRMEHERLEEFVKAIVERMETLESDLSKGQEEMGKMLSSAMSYVRNDPQASKVPLYVGCLVEFGISDVGAIEITNLLQELDSIDFCDIEVLKKIVFSCRIDDALGLDEKSPHPNVASQQVSVKKLESRGLLFSGGVDQVLAKSMYLKPEVWPYSFFRQEFVVSPNGLLLLRIHEKYLTV